MKEVKQNSNQLTQSFGLYSQFYAFYREYPKIYTWDQFKGYISQHYCRRQVLQIISDTFSQTKWRMSGYCDCCKEVVKLLVDRKYAAAGEINFRERFVCPKCELNARQRLIISLAVDEVKAGNYSDVYIQEQKSAFFKKLDFFLMQHNSSINLVGSEYIDADKQPGRIYDGVRHEDAQKLSFRNSSFDLLITNDVFEHVPDIKRALSESYRILKKGGTLLASFPFCSGNQNTVKRAEFKNGKLICYLPKVYHGNPLSEEGSLVFYDFGWDFLNMIKRVGFQDVYALDCFNPFLGYISSTFLIFVAKK